MASNLRRVLIGTWRCTAEQSHDQRRTDTIVLRVAANGRFAMEPGPDADLQSLDLASSGKPGENVGTWSMHGLRAKVAIPYTGDGRHGFNRWTYVGNDAVPTRLDGTTSYEYAERFTIELHRERIDLVQVRGPAAPNGDRTPNPAWRIACTKTSNRSGVVVAPMAPHSD